MQINKIKIRTLGGFSVWVNDEPALAEGAKITKPWQLFCYLVVNRARFVDSRKLISVLWGDDELSDPANVLKNAVYSLRKELCGGESSTDSPIIYSSGGYRFDPMVELELDIDQLDTLYTHMAELPESDNDTKIEICNQMLELYNGDFLAQLDQNLWVIPIALDMRTKYLKCMQSYCSILASKGQYKEMLEVAKAAHEIDPLDEEIILYMFAALKALRMYRVIVTAYSRVAQKFSDTLDSRPPDNVFQIYKEASERINKTEQDIIVIKTELSGAEQGQRPQRGAYFCSYTELKYVCPLLRRTAERNHQKLMIALFTLVPDKNTEVSPEELARTMAEFKVLAMANLRKTDTLARYSKNQYVILIAVKSLDDGRLVRDRIKSSLTSTTSERKINLDIKLAEA